jgi:hypothetical protein
MRRLSSPPWRCVPVTLLPLAAAPTVAACGARTGIDLDVTRVAHEGLSDAPADEDGRDALSDEGDSSTEEVTTVGPCDLGSVVGDVFGQVVYFANGSALAPGRYRVTYVDGCMKYSGVQDWSVNAYGPGSPPGSDGWWIVGASSADQIVMPPGTVGFLVGSGGFANFDDCVAANLLLPPVDFQFAGGQLGLWLEDSPYSDNVIGNNGRSPTWRLTDVGACQAEQ